MMVLKQQATVKLLQFGLYVFSNTKSMYAQILRELSIIVSNSDGQSSHKPLYARLVQGTCQEQTNNRALVTVESGMQPCPGSILIQIVSTSLPKMTKRTL
ncbi:hypothetical protein MHYP_G00123820 [Metynnis hypsauchen]